MLLLVLTLTLLCCVNCHDDDATSEPLTHTVDDDEAKAIASVVDRAGLTTTLENKLETLHVTEANWLQKLAPYLNWPADEPCTLSMVALMKEEWTALADKQHDEVMFCLIKNQWVALLPVDFVTMDTTCDALMDTYNHTAWDAIDALTRRILSDCVTARLLMATMHRVTGFGSILKLFRATTGLPYNMMHRLWKCTYVRAQYEVDRVASADKLRLPAYAKAWAFMDLSVDHYAMVDSVGLPPTYSAYCAQNGVDCEDVDPLVDYVIARVGPIVL